VGPPEQVRLQQVQRIDVGIPPIEALGEPLATDQLVAAADLQDELAPTLVLADQFGEEALAEVVVREVGVLGGNLRFGASEGERRVVKSSERTATSAYISWSVSKPSSSPTSSR